MVYAGTMPEVEYIMPSGYSGQLDPGQDGGQYGAQVFLVQQLLARCNTVELVKVIACRPIGVPVADPLLMSGVVDIKMMVNMMNGDNEPIEHGTLYNVPYFRIQAGGNAIKIDPKLGDIGIAVFCARDISTVKTTKVVSNPGSWGRFSVSDGIYLGGVLNDLVPIVQAISFSDTAIDISALVLNIVAPEVNITGAVAISGSLRVNGRSI